MPVLFGLLKKKWIFKPTDITISIVLIRFLKTTQNLNFALFFKIKQHFTQN